MTMELSTQDDFVAWADGLEAVTLTRRESGESVAVAAALCRRTVAQEAEPSGGAAVRADATWLVPLPAGEAAPRVGDVLRDGLDGKWTILEVEAQRLLGRWKCVARNLRVAFGINDRVDVQRAEWDLSGEEPVFLGWSFVCTALPVRIQPAETTIIGPMNAPESTARYTVILGEPYPLQPGDRLVGPDGAIYRLESIEQSERIDVLPVARVVRVGEV